MERASRLVTNLDPARKSKAKQPLSIKISPARLAAFEILRRVEEEGAYASVRLAQKQNDLSARDRSLSHELTLGVLRWQLKLDHFISHFAGRNSARLDLPVRIALRLGLYQLRFLSRIPASAAVNEAVELVRFARLHSAEKFVNAVLRRALREPDYDPIAAIQDSSERLAVETSHPRWLIERWSAALGPDEASAFARANNEAAPVSFRFTHKEPNQEEILAKLKDAGASLIPSKIVSNAWRITGATDHLQGLMQRGQVYLQDEASQLVAHALAPQTARNILDVCAAPGSKTTHIAALTNDRALIVASDLHEHRLRAVANAARLQHRSGLLCVCLDARRPLPFVAPVFDRVLVDAPCSGTGTLRRNPEIRWRIRPEDIMELSDHQKELLSNAAKMVRPGGRLVYSTCSVEPEENEEVVKAFLEKDRAFVNVQPPLDPSLFGNAGSIRTWPHRHGTDGFFITVFENKA
jgi:16S rRNA (cytosine967-C5)-methyltransferase